MVVSSRKFFLLLGLGLVSGLGAGFVHAQIPPGFEVIRLTDDPDMDVLPAINNLGHVVWSKRINQGFDTEEIFLWDGVQVRRITNDNVRDAFPDINDNGTIVWSRAKRPGEANNLDIVLWRNGELTYVTDDEIWDSAASINNLDHVAWYQTIGGSCSGFADIFFYDGETVRQITDSGRGLLDQAVEINDSDELAWTRYDFCQNPWRGTIILYSGGLVVELSDGMGQEQSAAVNNATQVGWGIGEDGVMLWEEELARVLTSWGEVPRINGPGEVELGRWHEDISATKQWVYRNGEFLRLTDDDVSEFNASINDCSEVAWERGPFPTTDVFLMRMIPGDTDHDGTVAVSDLSAFHACLTGPREATLMCGGRSSDLDADGDVDLRDYTLFGALTQDHSQYQRLLGCMTGPRQASSHCDCLAGDFDRDGDVDLRDYVGLQKALVENP